MPKEPESKKPELQELEIHSLCSHRTFEGRVSLIINKKEISQWDIRKAKEIHAMLGEAIEAAISDELVVKFLIKAAGLLPIQAIMALKEFRELRQGSKETVYPS